MTEQTHEALPQQPVNGAQATETDEEDVLRTLYGPPDENGVYHGSGAI